MSPLVSCFQTGFFRFLCGPQRKTEKSGLATYTGKLYKEKDS